MIKQIGLREIIITTDDPGVIDAAALCTHMSGKTRRAIARAAAKRRKELTK